MTCEALDWTKFASVLELENKPNDKLIREIAEYAGNLKLSFNKQANEAKLSKIKEHDEMFNIATKLASVFEIGFIDFLNCFVLQRSENSLDELALDSIVNCIEIFQKYNPGKLMEEVIPIIRGGNICKKNSEEGKLHITNLSGLFACPRKYVYICGLSANEFPGGAKENYLLLDTDLQNFEGSILSQQKILNNIQLFESVTGFIESLGCEQKFSFSYYDLSELKNQNASSVLYKLFDDVSSIPKVNYFESHLSSSREVCDKYKNGIEINYEVDAPQVVMDADLFERR